MEFRIEPASPADMGLVRDSWRRSYRASPLAASAKPPVYGAFIVCWMDHMLARGRVRVARPMDWQDGVISWACAEQEPTRFAVHYCFTKAPFRRNGVMRALLESFEPHGELVFTSLVPPFSDHLRNLGYAHDPRVASTFRVSKPA